MTEEIDGPGPVCIFNAVTSPFRASDMRERGLYVPSIVRKPSLLSPPPALPSGYQQNLPPPCRMSHAGIPSLTTYFPPPHTRCGFLTFVQPPPSYNRSITSYFQWVKGWRGSRVKGFFFTDKKKTNPGILMFGSVVGRVRSCEHRV